MVLTAFSTARSPRTWTVNLLMFEALRHKANTIFKTLIFCLRAAKKGDGLTNRGAYYRQFVSTLFHCKSNLTQKPDWVKKNLRPHSSESSVNTRSAKNTRWQMWSSSAAWMGSSGCRLWSEQVFRWMWACVRPRHRATSVRLTGLCCRMTRLCCRRDKDKLQSLENISTLSFFFFFLTLSTSAQLFFFLSFFFFLALGVIQMCATLEGDDEKGRGRSSKMYQGVRSCPPHCSQVR